MMSPMMMFKILLYSKSIWFRILYKIGCMDLKMKFKVVISMLYSKLRRPNISQIVPEI